MVSKECYYLILDKRNCELDNNCSLNEKSKYGKI